GTYIDSEEDGFDKWLFDFSIFHSYGDFTVGHFISNSSVSGNVIYYNQLAFGDSRIVRGHNFPRQFGNHLLLSRHEIRYRFLDDELISLNPPIFSKFTQNMRVSCFAYSFLDTGVLYENLAKVQYNDFKTGYGIGVGMYMPYMPYFALEYGLNALGYREFTIALRASL
ncbi:MAG: hypothetical protein KDD94_05225, partial [Calditrichaeota bacterium]|nr:hypothetical protein [Calditrichota bacterium]